MRVDEVEQSIIVSSQQLSGLHKKLFYNTEQKIGVLK